jgi:hypothetical protein
MPSRPPLRRPSAPRATCACSGRGRGRRRAPNCPAGSSCCPPIHPAMCEAIRDALCRPLPPSLPTPIYGAGPTSPWGALAPVQAMHACSPPDQLTSLAAAGKPHRQIQPASLRPGVGAPAALPSALATHRCPAVVRVALFIFRCPGPCNGGFQGPVFPLNVLHC